MLRALEMEDSSFPNQRFTKPYRKRCFRGVTIRPVFPLIVVAILCFVFFQAGSKFNSANKLENHEIETLRTLMSSERPKRSIQEVERITRKRVFRRNSGDAIRPRFDVGATYTRWGRRDCGGREETSVVYSGIAAGSYYSHMGGGSNLLCLSNNVTYSPGNYVEGFQDVSYLYGVEYRTPDTLRGLFNFSETGGDTNFLHAVPCSVCMAHAKITQLMIPGVDYCPDGWTREYRGYIMGSNHGHKHTTDYVCVDQQPHVVPGSGGDQAGALLYMVETVCPSLQCEPYVSAREVRCVVCTI